MMIAFKRYSPDKYCVVRVARYVDRSVHGRFRNDVYDWFVYDFITNKSVSSYSFASLMLSCDV